jgi:hypothetical protein
MKIPSLLTSDSSQVPLTSHSEPPISVILDALPEIGFFEYKDAFFCNVAGAADCEQVFGVIGVPSDDQTLVGWEDE